MATTLEDEIAWYKQFSRPGPVDWSVDEANTFWPVAEDRLQQFEARVGRVMPYSIRTFLQIVGEGRFTRDESGGFAEFYTNVFLSPEEMAAIVLKESDVWRVYPNFMQPGDLPFFDLGSSEVIVMSQVVHAGSVRFAYGEEVASTFEAFLSELRCNVAFYV